MTSISGAHALSLMIASITACDLELQGNAPHPRAEAARRTFPAYCLERKKCLRESVGQEGKLEGSRGKRIPYGAIDALSRWCAALSRGRLSTLRSRESPSRSTPLRSADMNGYVLR